MLLPERCPARLSFSVAVLFLGFYLWRNRKHCANQFHYSADRPVFPDEQDMPIFDDASTSVDALVSEAADKAPMRDALAPSIGGQSQSNRTSESPGREMQRVGLQAAVSKDINPVVESQSAVQHMSGPSAQRIITPALPIIPRKPASEIVPHKEREKSLRLPATASDSPNSVHHEELTPGSVPVQGVHAASSRKSVANSVKTQAEGTKVDGNKSSGPVLATSGAPPTARANAPARSIKEGIKRLPPGKLDIAAATRNLIKETQALSATGPSKSAGNKHVARSSTAVSAGESRSVFSGSLATGPQTSSITRSAQPKTLRVLPTAKAEPAPLASIPAAAGFASPSVHMLPQKPMVASASGPATPAGELQSDNTSLRSSSLSRANSPPPSNVGSGPMRHVSKTQLKKQRREVRKEAEKREVEEASTTPPVEEKEIAPIVGKKKKKVKTKQISSAAEDSTPSVTRPSSPVLESKSPERKSSVVIAANALIFPKEAKVEIEPQVKTEDLGPPGITDHGEAVVDDPTQKSYTTPASIIAELTASGELDALQLAFFKSVNGVNHRHDINPAELAELNRKITISDEDQAKLADGEAVRIPGKENDPQSGVMVTPSGYLLRGLTLGEQQRFLELEKRTTETKAPYAWTPPGKGGENGFYMVEGRVVQSTGPVSMNGSVGSVAGPAGPSTAPSSTGRVRVNEALNYINQFVLPTLPAHGDIDSNPFSFRVDESATDTGKAPDPSQYTAYINPTISTSISSDVVGVVHDMVSGLAPTTGASLLSDKRPGMTSSRGALIGKNAGGILSRVPLMSVEESDSALALARKDTEALEKKMNGLIKKNRKMALGSLTGLGSF